MKTKHFPRLVPLLLAIAGVAVICPKAAATEDFVFYVPVELHHINPDAKEWFISVLVCDANWAEGANITHMIVAQGGVEFEVVDGEYAGTLTVLQRKGETRQTALCT